jgi:transcription elongation GreA/GreB family factor
MGLRQELYLLCSSHVASRMADTQIAIAQLYDAMANDTKSSAGDKYETGREMLQQQMNLNLASLNELSRAKAILDSVANMPINGIITPGSVVHTSNGNYYMAAGIGAFICNGTKYHTISAASPIGRVLAGLKENDIFQLNNVGFTITGVF